MAGFGAVLTIGIDANRPSPSFFAASSLNRFERQDIFTTERTENAMSTVADKVQVQLPDGTIADHPGHATPMDIAKGISEGLARSVMAAEVDGKIVDACRPLGELAEGDQPLALKLLTTRDSDALDVLRHSAAHVMARAVMRLYQGVSLAFGPTTEGGFYYDFDIPEKISEDDFPKI